MRWLLIVLAIGIASCGYVTDAEKKDLLHRDADRDLRVAVEFAECMQRGIDVFFREAYSDSAASRQFLGALLLPCRHIAPGYYEKDMSQAFTVTKDKEKEKEHKK